MDRGGKPRSGRCGKEGGMLKGRDGGTKERDGWMDGWMDGHTSRPPSINPSIHPNHIWMDGMMDGRMDAGPPPDVQVPVLARPLARGPCTSTFEP
jgi:hypothetical protein